MTYNYPVNGKLNRTVMDVQLNDIALYVEVAKRKNFSRAAQALDIPTSTNAHYEGYPYSGNKYAGSEKGAYRRPHEQLVRHATTDVEAGQPSNPKPVPRSSCTFDVS